ncbi:MAG: hypothetical protein V1810_00800 [Candidatus Beckwithbacteria bacterium]
MASSNNVIGTINPPGTFSGYKTIEEGGLAGFLSNLIYLLIVVAGLFTLVNFILAGYLYLGANANPQQIQAAANKILQSMIGLAVVAFAFIIAGLIGFLFFKDATFLFTPIFGGF